MLVVAIEEGVLPHYKALEGEALEEERRLCYVAFTRAKRRLGVSTCRWRMLWGRPWELLPSRFLAEAGLR